MASELLLLSCTARRRRKIQPYQSKLTLDAKSYEYTYKRVLSELYIVDGLK